MRFQYYQSTLEIISFRHIDIAPFSVNLFRVELGELGHLAESNVEYQNIEYKN